MRSRLLSFSFPLALASMAAGSMVAPPGVSAEVVERILAVVEGAPVLLSEVELVERLRGVERTAALEAMIDERLMFREASRLAQSALGAAEEERAFQGLHAAAGDLGNEQELRRLARRQAAILRYIEFRFGAQVRIDDEAVRKEWEAERPEGVAVMSAEDETRIRQRLAAQELDEKIEASIRELRAGADVRYNP